MGSLRFRFADEEESADYVARLAADMQQYDPQDVLCGSYIYRSWRPDLVNLLRLSESVELLLDVWQYFCCRTAVTSRPPGALIWKPQTAS